MASPEFNLEKDVGMHAIRGLDDYDFTPEDGSGGAPLYDDAVAYEPQSITYEEKEVKTADFDAASVTGDMFDPLAETRRVFAEMDKVHTHILHTHSLTHSLTNSLSLSLSLSSLSLRTTRAFWMFTSLVWRTVFR